jgi:hypothetical protein
VSGDTASKTDFPRRTFRFRHGQPDLGLDLAGHQGPDRLPTHRLDGDGRFTMAAIGMFLLARLRGEDLRLTVSVRCWPLPWGCCSSAAISSSSIAPSIT